MYTVREICKPWPCTTTNYELGACSVDISDRKYSQ